MFNKKLYRCMTSKIAIFNSTRRTTALISTLSYVVMYSVTTIHVTLFENYNIRLLSL